MLEAGLAAKGLTVADLDKKVPFGRIGRPEEVAALVAFPASDGLHPPGLGAGGRGGWAHRCAGE
jgi:NAD(P)-dependent dehydrogenase (short-subunit alcohol dehydrogenase family)